VLGADTTVRAAYGSGRITERHRHRYEVNNAYRDRLSDAGLVFSGTSPDGKLVEFVELPRDVHPFFVGTQAHPELKSRPTRAHPLFRAFVAASLRHVRSGRLDLDTGSATGDDDRAESEARVDGVDIPAAAPVSS
jgi:CTP synthase